MPHPHPKQKSFSITRVLALLIGCFAVPMIGLLAYGLIKMDTKLKVNPESGLIVVREKNLSPKKTKPSWAGSIPTEFTSTSRRTRNEVESQTYAGAGEIIFYDYLRGREIYLRSVLHREAEQRPRISVEIKTPAAGWRTVPRLVSLNPGSPQLFEDPIHGISIAYTLRPNYPSGELWIQPLTEQQPIRMGEGQSLSMAPSKSVAVFVARCHQWGDLLTLDSPRFGFILWDIERQELKQISSRVIPDWRSGIPLYASWSEDSKFIRLSGLTNHRDQTEAIYSVEHDELYHRKK